MRDSDGVDEKAWAEWLQLPQTKALREWAAARRLDLMENWADGAFSDGFDVAMAVKNAGATGACSVYKQLSEMEYSLIIEGRSEDAK